MITKNFKSAMLNLPLTRLTILPEFEPGDAVQSGYFRHLYELRNALSESGRQTVAASVTAGRIKGMAGYGNA